MGLLGGTARFSPGGEDCFMNRRWEMRPKENIIAHLKTNVDSPSTEPFVLIAGNSCITS